MLYSLPTVPEVQGMLVFVQSREECNPRGSGGCPPIDIAMATGRGRRPSAELATLAICCVGKNHQFGSLLPTPDETEARSKEKTAVIVQQKVCRFSP
ncbi:hypothetical protein EVAR_36085_1 [Eumeta japonica]|uniref:Uncharacterized protein n=1 Tax=Eumeta variegata TaxID=151549 RepID=A0A4C1YIK5_EUMVA|nr:hypothetical protein EVAR_36085_1 [Eumeta japonica]